MTSSLAVPAPEQARHPRFRRVAGVLAVLQLAVLARSAPSVVLDPADSSWVGELFWFQIAGVRLVWIDYLVVPLGGALGLAAVVTGAVRGDRVLWALGAAGLSLAAVAAACVVRALGQYG